MSYQFAIIRPMQGATPAKTATTPLSWSPAWTVEEGPTGVILTAGHDLRLGVDGISAEAAATLMDWERNETIDPSDFEDLTLVSHLLDLGVLGPAPHRRSLTLATDDQFSATLVTTLQHRGWEIDSDGDLALAIRTGATYPAPVATPHLLVDVALHHTLVLGPLVIPGLTSCVECLRVRVERRWPTGAIPMVAAMQTRPALVAELVGLHAAMYFAGSSPLINATVTWDFRTGASSRERLLRVPDCSACKATPYEGRLGLPWTQP